MNLKQLEAFVKVTETKSFSEAAKQLFLTQPTVSAHVSALEKELNTCFLIRNTRGVGLNFFFLCNNDSDIIPKSFRYHSEGRELVKMSVLRAWGI